MPRLMFHLLRSDRLNQWGAPVGGQLLPGSDCCCRVTRAMWQLRRRLPFLWCAQLHCSALALSCAPTWPGLRPHPPTADLRGQGRYFYVDSNASGLEMLGWQGAALGALCTHEPLLLDFLVGDAPVPSGVFGAGSGWGEGGRALSASRVGAGG